MKQSTFNLVLALSIIIIFSFKSKAQVCFDAPVTYTPGVAPKSIAAADFNGDGKKDLVVSNSTSSNVSVFLNSGTGTFLAAINYNAGVYPGSITTADFNNDNKQDIAVCNYGSANISVFMGSGSGTFGTATNFVVGLQPTFIQSSDLNGDGKADLAITNNGSSNVSILLGTGTGSFAAATNFSCSSSSGPVGLTIADLNNDTKKDIAVVGNVGNLYILIGTGTGSFNPAVSSFVGPNLHSITSGDFNADGNIDLAVSNANSISSLVTILGNGTGAFGPNSAFMVAGSYAAMTADFNNDGKADVITSSWGNTGIISIAYGNGTATLSPVVNSTLTLKPRFMCATDFNNDGKIDIAAVNELDDKISVLINNTPVVNAVSSNSVLCAGQIATLTANGAVTYSWSNGSNANTTNVSPNTTVSYTVTGANATGCTNKTIITQSVTICTSLNENLDNTQKIYVYPNPANQQIHFELNDNAIIYVVNMVGQIVQYEKMLSGTKTLNIESLKAGIYFLKINSGNKQQVIKIIKE